MNDRVGLCRAAVSMVTVVGLCLATAFLGGCCTTKCCVSEKCTDLSACSSPDLRMVKVVKNRVTSCPDIWATGLAVMADDKVRVVNCSGMTAKIKFTPATFFVGAGEIELAAGLSTTLTVRSDVTVDDEVVWIVTGDGACSHGGSRVIVRPGP